MHPKYAYLAFVTFVVGCGGSPLYLSKDGGKDLGGKDLSGSADGSNNPSDSSDSDAISSQDGGGQPDSAVVCAEGATRSCSADGFLGNCKDGIETCTGNTWGPCSISAAASDRCDVKGDDGNCNGKKNEGCPCVNGDTQPCGPPADQGICKRGTQACVNGQWDTTCHDAVMAKPRDCTSAQDNDCDGKPDNTVDSVCQCGPISGTQACDKHPQDGMGPCHPGTQTCKAGPNNSSSSWTGCTGSVGPAAADTCDPDNDATCNGKANEGCACVNGKECAAQTCSNGRLVTAQTCANASCPAGTPQDCTGGFICSGAACKTSCASNNDCRANFYCQAGTCHVDAIKVEAGESHACALLTDGTVRCWGVNGSYGALGNNSTSDFVSPVAVTGLSGAVDLSASVHTCAVLAGGSIQCWGSNAYGQIGDGTKNDHRVPTPVANLTGATQVSAGTDHTCAVASGAAWCWGNGDNGALGDGTMAEHLKPSAVKGLDGLTIKAVMVRGPSFSCALTSTGDVWCWGKLALPGVATTGGFALLPTRVSSLSGATDISAGTAHICAVISGNVHCLGDNTYNQLGVSDTSVQDVPTVPGIQQASKIAARYAASCAVTTGGAIWCWGNNADGEAGIDPASGATQPPRAVLGSGATFASVAALFVCGTMADGSAECWGDGQGGQLGNGMSGTNYRSFAPVVVNGW